MKKQITIIFAFCFIFICEYSYAQRDNIYSIDASAVVGTKQTPFWMRANKFGKVPIKGQTMAIFAGVKSDYKNPVKKIDWGYGLNIGGFAGMQNKFLIQQAYAKAKWKVFELYAGRREEIQGLVDTTLTSGSYIWSGNALPMPKIDISIPEYTPIGPSGIFAIKGNYAHAWFEPGRSDAKGILLHQKSGYFRIGKPNYKLKVYGGFNHQAQWGGQQISGKKLESSFKDYLNIVMGKSNVGEDTTGLDPNSAGNRTGNHLGSLDIGFEFKLMNSNIFIYRQSIFEDGSLFYLNNIADGLNGFSIAFNKKLQNKFSINKINFEFLSTLSQGGIFGSSGGIPESKRGQDNYFNNSDFLGGWSYNKTSMGTPFILGKSQFIQTNTSKKSELFFTNNRVQAYIISANGNLFDDYFFIARFSYSKNWGTYNFPFSSNMNQTSFTFNINRNLENILGGINAYASISADFGAVFTSNFATQVGFKKSFGFLPFLNLTHKHY